MWYNWKNIHIGSWNRIQSQNQTTQVQSMIFNKGAKSNSIEKGESSANGISSTGHSYQENEAQTEWKWIK